MTAREATPKQCLQTILEGGIPQYPPHWELVFQIEREFFGMDTKVLDPKHYSSQEAYQRAVYDHQFEVYSRLVDGCGWAAVRGGYDPEEVRIGKRRIGDRALLAGYEGDGVFWMPSGADIMDFVVQLYEKPNELHAEAREKCDTARMMLTRLADAGADFFVLTYDFGFNDAPFVSPDQFREFVTPYLTELVQHAHDLGKKVILHSDGCITQILDQIHGTGIDGYQSVDPQGHMDIKEVRASYPDWILMGNVACNMLQDFDDTKIRESVRYCMEYGGVGARYIFSTSNCIFAGMPPESYRTMLNEYHRLIGLPD